MTRFAKAVDQLLVWFILFQMIALTGVVIFAVLARITGNSVSWYDEIAAIQLAWLTYYGGAYAALHRRHIGFDTVLLAIPMPLRAWAALFAEGVIIGFFRPARLHRIRGTGGPGRRIPCISYVDSYPINTVSDPNWRDTFCAL